MNIKERLAKLKGKEKKEHILMIDAMNMFCRNFTTVNTINKYGNHVGGFVGFLKSLGASIKQFQPDKVYIVFEGDNSSQMRKQIYPLYKSTRLNKGVRNKNVFFDEEENDESFNHQLLSLILYLQNLPVYLLSVDNYEADDIIAYLAKKSCLKSKVTIISSDKDYFQLVDENIDVYNPVAKKMYKIYDVYERFNVYPCNFAVFRSLIGDISDAIPPVRGIGDVTAVKYYPELTLNKKVTLDNLFESAINHVNTTKKPLQKYTTLLESKEQVLINKKLIDLSDIQVDAIGLQIISEKLEEKLNFNVEQAVKKAKELNVENEIGYNKSIETWLAENFYKLKK